jgi:hypothetical protein
MLSRSKSIDDTEARNRERKRLGIFRSRRKVSTANQSKYDERDEDELETGDEKKRGWKNEKNQKKVVYSQFSDDPKAVLEVVSDQGIPKITSKDEVVIKVQVRLMSGRSHRVTRVPAVTNISSFRHPLYRTMIVCSDAVSISLLGILYVVLLPRASMRWD